MVSNDDQWRVLHLRLCGIAKRRAALDAEEAKCLRDAVAIKLWLRLGYVHLSEYLERELGLGPQASVERVRVAQALAHLPRIEASLGEGALAFSAVRELTRVATGDTEQAWLDAARGKNLRQIEAMVSGKRAGDRPDDPTRPELVNRVLRLELSPAAFAAFREVQTAMAEEHGGRLDDSALIETLCRRALESAAAGDVRPAHQIAYTVCQSCRRGWQNGAGREIEVGPEVIARAQCDAEIIGSIDAEQPERVVATVTPRLRRQVLARDHHCCTVPGCRSARNLDVHHIRFRSEGGGNELANMLTLCSGHHALLHNGVLVIRGEAPNALEFSWREDSARGERVGSVGEVPTPPQAAAVDRDACAALTTAGYRLREAQAAVARARPHVGAEASLELLLREALRRCGPEHAGAAAPA